MKEGSPACVVCVIKGISRPQGTERMKLWRGLVAVAAGWAASFIAGTLAGRVLGLESSTASITLILAVWLVGSVITYRQLSKSVTTSPALSWLIGALIVTAIAIAMYNFSQTTV